MAIWRSRPSYAVVVVVVLLSTAFLLLNPFTLYSSQPVPPMSVSLPNRIRQAERIYQDTLRRRADMVKKIGSTPQDLASFPPTSEPWPPYTIWDFFPPAFNCPHELQRVGVLGDGGKWVCGLSRLQRKQDCIIYSFGLNGESSYEQELLENTRSCQIWGYDFSVTSFGPEIRGSLRERTHFFPYGLSGEDKHGPEDNPKMYTLETLMKMNKHKHIDVIKIDIEGWEFKALSAFVQSYLSRKQPLPFGQLQVEVHASGDLPSLLEWFRLLETAGLRPFMNEVNLVYSTYHVKGDLRLVEYSFINTKGDNVLIHD